MQKTNKKGRQCQAFIINETPHKFKVSTIRHGSELCQGYVIDETKRKKIANIDLNKTKY